MSCRTNRALIQCLAAFAFSLAAVFACAPRLAADEPAPIDFERQIAPLLVASCLGCHNVSDRQGGLVLSSHEGLLAGGDEGQVFTAEAPLESRLFARVVAGEMPPEERGESRKLPEHEIALLRAWLAAGAPWPEGRTLGAYEFTTDRRAGLDWWSLRPLADVEVPYATAGLEPAAANPIDAFVESRLKAEGFEPAPPADPRALVRRVYNDLVGLPPTYEEIEAFVADPSPAAYEALIDRLLASPHFGERYARYWLDLVRFAETCGYERDQEKPNAWRYRDWVVDAINADMPYDRFVVEQLAGDEIEAPNEQSVIATGFLRLGTWNDEPNDPFEYKYERLEDLIHTTTTAFLGLTVKCARCHDHKFDPIPQVDYYRLAAVFWAGYVEPRGADLLGGPSRDELGFDVLGYTDRAREPPPLPLLAKGDPHRPGDEIAAGALSCVATLPVKFEPPPVEAKTSRRRLQLARWIVDPQNPLAARLAVNRLWQSHFGAGLVRTPDNFGFTGERPTHPELFDWLARQLIAGGWQLKPLHKLVLMSRMYRQSTIHPRGGEIAPRDAANRLWWRAERRRLDAEALRDALLEVSGQLDRRIGGPSFRPQVSDEALEGLSMKGGAWNASPPEEQRRRSLYMFSKRSLLAPLMTTFDFADTTQSCARRDVTTVAPQALALLNNEFVHQASDALARRVLAAESEPPRRVALCWRLALGRLPLEHETERALAHVELQERRFAALSADLTPAADSSGQDRAWASLCHVLLNANEFIYVD